MAFLAKKIALAEKTGKDVSPQRISLRVAELFSDYILADSERDLKSWQRLKFSDVRIIGQEEFRKRVSQLAKFEFGECQKIVKNAISELESAANLPSKGYYRKDIFYRDGCRLDIKNGCFTLDGKPTFFYGFLQQYKSLEEIRSLGSNLAFVWYTGSWLRKDWTINRDKSYLCRRLKDNGYFIYVSLVVGSMPKWLTAAYPDVLTKTTWWRPHFDIDHPIVRRVATSAGEEIAKLVKHFPNLFCYSLMGEQHCKPAFKGPATQKRYATWLEQHFGGNLKRLNQAFNKSYHGFTEAANDSGPKSTGMLYCWNLFNQYRLTKLNKWLIDGIRQTEKNPRCVSWPATGCLVAQPVGGWHSRMGVNFEDLITQASVSGWDGGFYPCEAQEALRYWPREQEKYNLAWRDEMTYYDFAKSVAPEQPIFDPEWHSLASVRHISPLGISADYVRLCLWMQHLHGLGAHTAWWWSRERDGTPRNIEFLGSFLTQPQLLEGWARTMLELERLAEYVTLFPVEERKVRILYSEASSIIDCRGYTNVMREAYEALYFQDCPIGFITEKMIAAGNLKECALLVVPNARYVGDSTVKGVKQFIQNGGKVAVIGKESFKFNEYGHERQLDFPDKTVFVPGHKAAAWFDRFDRLITAAGVKRPVRVLGPDGKPVPGLEMRTVLKGDRRIIYLLNLGHASAELTPGRKNGAVPKVRDLIGNRDLDLNKTIKLPPRGIMLLEVKSHE
ncbi:MAG: beta-galactosidase [Victivallales bacterium]